MLKQLVLAILVVSHAALAQTFPTKPVRVVVPFPPGGGTDIVARTVTPKMAEILGQPFVVENRVGAGGAIAAEFVAKSAPDGYTLFFAASPQFSLPLLQKVNFDPYKDFIPVSIVGTNPFVLGIHESVPAKTCVSVTAIALGLISIGPVRSPKRCQTPFASRRKTPPP